MKNILENIKTQAKLISKYIIIIFFILLYWELIIYYSLNLSIDEFSIWNILFLIPISIMLASFVGFNDKLNKYFFPSVLFIVCLFYLINYIYFKTFGSLISISMVGAGGDAINNFWWSIATTIKENLLMIYFFLLPIILLIVEEIFLKKTNTTYKLIAHPINFVVGIVVWFVIVGMLFLCGQEDYTTYGVYHSRYVDTDTASKKLGALPNAIVETRYAIFGSGNKGGELISTGSEEQPQEVIIDETIEYNIDEKLNLKDIKQKSSDPTVKNICDYLSSQLPTEKNQYTGIFKGFNLIYICAESFSSLAIDPVITPTLYKMANNGVVLNNYYNGFRNVTTNGEYALLTGLWPDIAREETNMGALTGTMGQSINKNMSQALGNKFNTLGIQSRGYHNFYGYYYGRNKTLPNMGFDCKFMNAGMTFTSSWPASDLEMMQQSIPDYVNDDQFCVYYMTFSGHGGYSQSNVIGSKNLNTILEKLNNKQMSECANIYLSCNYELELAMEYLLCELDANRALENTVIVLAGDHYPYYLTDTAYNELRGEKRTYSFEDYKSTCIIYNERLLLPIIVDEPCCNVDILPTILNLFGVDYDSRLYAGTDVLSNGQHVAMLYNKSFVTDKVKYNSANGKAVWLDEENPMSEQEQKEYIKNINDYVKNKYAYSTMVEQTDFYNYLYKQ